MADLNEQIKSVVEAAQAAGVEKFVFMLKPTKDQATIRFEGVTMSDAIQLMIAGFHQAIQIDLDRHPEFSDEYKQIFLDFREDLNKIVKKSNAATVAFRKKHAPQLQRQVIKKKP